MSKIPSIPFNVRLNKKKQRIYVLLFVSAIFTFLLVAGFNYHLLKLREEEGVIFLMLSKQRSSSQNMVNMLFADTYDAKFYEYLHTKVEDWYATHDVFFAKVKEKNQNESDEVLVNTAIKEMQLISQKIDDAILAINSDVDLAATIPVMVKLQDQYISKLNTLSRITLQSSNQKLNRLVFTVSTSILLALLIFAYLFIFQIRPLFDQIFHKNEELRKISSKQSHIYRAPLANILGLLYLVENAETIDEILEYIRLIKLNAEAMDDRIHKVVEHAEQLFEFDGKSTESLNELIVMDKGVVLK